MNFERMPTQTNNWSNAFCRPPPFGGLFYFAVTGWWQRDLHCPAILFRGRRARHFGQKLIHALFRFFVGYLRASGLVELDAGGLSALRKSEG